MAEFLFLMHDDSESLGSIGEWDSYIAGLRAAGVFDGGSAMGGGEALRKEGRPGLLAGHLAGYVRVRADGADEARKLLAGNPVFERGGTVEIRALPRN